MTADGNRGPSSHTVERNDTREDAARLVVWKEPKVMARKYSKSASRKVAKVMRERKRGTLRSGRSGKRVKSRKQAIAIGLSEARRSGARVPARRSSRSRKKK
jgi:hypothetical protein